MIGRRQIVEIEIRASDGAMRALEEAGVPLEIVIRQHYCEGDAEAWRAFVAEAKGGDIASRTEIDGDDMATARFTTVTSRNLRATRFLLEMEREWEMATGKQIGTTLLWYREPLHPAEVSLEPTRQERLQEIDGPVQGY